MDKIYVDAVGIKFRVDAGQDIGAATSTELHVQKPDGTLVAWTAAIESTDHLTYTVIAGDLDQAGIYRLHAAFVLGGWDSEGEVCEFTVYEKYH